MFDMNLAWYYQVWPWIGFGAAIVLVILLFSTSVLRNDLTKSRWKDPTWLAWLISVSYLLHNVEEYGMDLTGTMQAFPKAMESLLGMLPAGIFFAAVNLSLIWCASPIAAALSRKYRIMSVGLAGFMFINSLTHLSSFIATGKYNPGLLTVLVIFLPLTLWTFYACFGKGKLKYSALAAILIIGAISHVVLFGSILGLYGKGLIGDEMAALIQVLNAILILLLWYGAEKIAGGRLVKIKQ